MIHMRHWWILTRERERKPNIGFYKWNVDRMNRGFDAENEVRRKISQAKSLSVSNSACKYLWDIHTYFQAKLASFRYSTVSGRLIHWGWNNELLAFPSLFSNKTPFAVDKRSFRFCDCSFAMNVNADTGLWIIFFDVLQLDTQGEGFIGCFTAESNSFQILVFESVCTRCCTWNGWSSNTDWPGVGQANN